MVVTINLGLRQDGSLMIAGLLLSMQSRIRIRAHQHVVRPSIRRPLLGKRLSAFLPMILATFRLRRVTDRAFRWISGMVLEDTLRER